MKICKPEQVTGMKQAVVDRTSEKALRGDYRFLGIQCRSPEFFDLPVYTRAEERVGLAR